MVTILKTVGKWATGKIKKGLKFIREYYEIWYKNDKYDPIIYYTLSPYFCF
jgi:hypothetical protein